MSTVYRTTITALTVTDAENEARRQAEEFFDGRQFVYVSSHARQQSVTDSESRGFPHARQSVTDSESRGPARAVPTVVTVEWEFRECEAE